MSTALTATLPRAVIDLTGDGDSPPPAAGRDSLLPAARQGQKGDVGGRRASCEEPPAKRRCPEKAASGGGRRSLRACVQEQILPHVAQAVERLSRDEFRVDDIAVQAVATLARSSTFRIAVDEADGSPPPLPRAQAAIATAQVVQKLKALPQYQIRTPSFLGREVTHTVARPKPWVAQSSAGRGASCGVPEPRPFRGRERTRGQTTGPCAGARTWFRLKARPYLPAAERDLIARGATCPVRWRHGALEQPVVYHVDFAPDEIGQIFACLSQCFSARVPRTVDTLSSLCHEHDVASIVGDAVPGRNAEDIGNFCSDVMAGRAARTPRVLSLHQHVRDQPREERRASRIPSLLLARELEGNGRFGRLRRFENFQNEFIKAHEDGLAVVAEFTNCAGDLCALSWTPEGNILCGTTAHSDSHNQQYNKLGNLLLCSTTRGTLRAFADHRIPRPVVDKGENASESMRRSQDPWLYSSVVASDYDEAHRRGFTSSFDKTVKVWAVSSDGASMRAVATWHHGGNVNFVAAARDGSGRVASAADVPSEAVRVYSVGAGDDDDDVGASPYRAISCSRTDAAGSDRWAYFPATMQWGRAPGATHLLLVGYSPRSLTNDDRDIPDDKRDSGEIMLWDAARARRVPVMTATTANVFEVAWHPTLQRFIVATSPCGLGVEHGVRTQIHLFQLDRERHDGAYHEFQKLDCLASDINELTIVPNSLRHAYVTAGCTDGNVYVWDTAQGDDPIHVLRHGYPVDDFSYDREKEDTGVKFTAWGTTLDRLYTGSSDGVVKVWNVRNRRHPFVRDLLEAPGPISAGAFSPDHSKLAVGDATGRLFLLSLDGRDEHEAHLVTLPGPSRRRVRRPTPFIPHPEPPPPPGDEMHIDGRDDDDDDAHEAHEAAPHSIAAHARRAYLDSGQLVLHRNPVVGAVQGPAYASTGLFRRDAHLDEDAARPLLTEFERLQRHSLDASTRRRRRSERRLKNPLAAAPDADAPPTRDAEARHAANRRLDVEGLQWDFGLLWDSLRRDGAVLTDDGREDWGLAYEDGPAAESGGE